MKFCTLLLFFFLSFGLFSQNYSRCKVFANDVQLQTLAELGIPVDHGVRKKNTFLISDFSSDEMDRMKSNGFELEILILDVKQHYVDQNKGNEPEFLAKNQNCNVVGGSTDVMPIVPTHFQLGSMGGYYTYQEFIAEIDLMAATYPNLISEKATISTFETIEGNPLYWLKISDNPNQDEAEPEVLYTALHHAREPASLSEQIFYMWYLLENYATNDEVRYLVDNTEMYFVPMINPDGYQYNETTNPNGGGMWRKNRRNNGGGKYGVDLNRNYSHGWGTTGISTNPSNDTYPGTSAFSEIETQAIQWFCNNHDFQFALNAHTYGNFILFPIGTQTNIFAPDHDYFLAFSTYMVQYSGYIAQKSSTLYPASGDSDDYMYADDLTNKPKIFAMTPECGDDADGFWPAQSKITGIGQEMVFTNLMQAHLTHKYFDVKDLDPYRIENMTGSFTHEVTRFGLEDGVVPVTITPLLNIETIGSGTNYDIALNSSQTGSITYTLSPTIQYGDEIRYVLNSDFGLWTKRDTIRKVFGGLTLQVLDDASNSIHWTGNFSTTTEDFVSPSTSFTDSPNSDYSTNANSIFLFNDTIDLRFATDAQVSFYAKWNIEDNYDYARLEVSVDNGNTWIGQCGNYTNMGTSANGSVQPNNQPVYDGVQSDWVLEEINLSDYLGQKIRMRFILKSDGGVNEDGFYFDDFKVAFNEVQSGVGMVELSKTAVKVIPNPANQKVIISLDKIISSGEIRIYNLQGQFVYGQIFSSPTNKIEVATDSLPNGMYHLQILSGETLKGQEKMVIQH